MGKDTGFMEIPREVPTRRPAEERVHDWFEIYNAFPDDKLQAQGARCMDCGVPFCHGGCPVNNLIPDWNDLVYHGRWKEAIHRLHATNNFPEFTGRICPAPCEASCVLGITSPPVTIKQIEKSIVEHAFAEGWIHPEPPAYSTGKRVAVVGSGPAGLAASQQLRRAGHMVTLFEKAARIGGLLRYGIPNFKLAKTVLARRREHFDAVLLTGGAEQPRDLAVPGRELKGIHFAMEFLPQQNQRCEGDTLPQAADILATGKRVVIIGGGDTGADCLGTCHRQGVKSVEQFEIMPTPPKDRSPQTPWPLWPMQLRTEGAHEEGGNRNWSVATTRFTGDANGNVKQLHAVRVGPAPKFEPIPGSEYVLEVDLVLLAMGFQGPVKNGMIEKLGVALDARSNIATDENYMSSVEGVFAAGDMRRGQSLVVWAIAEGRKAAAAIDRYLTRAVMAEEISDVAAAGK